MTEMMDSSDVLVSAAMFFSSASGSTAPTAMATSTTRLTHGCGGGRGGAEGGAAVAAAAQRGQRGQRGGALRTCATMSTPVTLEKTMDMVSPMPMRYAVIAP